MRSKAREVRSLRRAAAARRMLGAESLEDRRMLANSLNLDLVVPLDYSFSRDLIQAELTGAARLKVDATILNPGDLSQVSAGVWEASLEAQAQGTIAGQSFSLELASAGAQGQFEILPLAEHLASFSAEQSGSVQGSIVTPFFLPDIEIDGAFTLTVSGQVDFEAWTFSADATLEVSAGALSNTFAFSVTDVPLPMLPDGFSLPDADLASIADQVWLDSNGNGVRDPGEPGLGDVLVKLFSPGANGVIGDDDDSLLATTITNALGNYSFVNLAAGEYYLGFEGLPSGLTFTLPALNGSVVDRLTGLTGLIDLSLGEHLQTIDAGVTTGSPWQNASNRFDVTADGLVSVADAVAVVRHLIDHGNPHLLPAVSSEVGPPPYVDVNGDGVASLRDVLDVIVELVGRLTGRGQGEGEPAAPSAAPHNSLPAAPLAAEPARPLSVGRLLMPAALDASAALSAMPLRAQAAISAVADSRRSAAPLGQAMAPQMAGAAALAQRTTAIGRAAEASRLAALAETAPLDLDLALDAIAGDVALASEG